MATVSLIIISAAVGVVVGLSLGRRTLSETSSAAAQSEGEDEAADVIHSVLEALPIAVSVSDVNGKCLYRNSCFRSLVSGTSAVLLEEAVERAVVSAARGGDRTERLTLNGPPGHTFNLRVGDESAIGFIVVVTDISEQTRVDAMRTDFVANISHELRTPIGAIAVLAEALEGEADPDVIGRLISRISGETERAVRTIEGLMELSSTERSDMARRSEISLGLMLSDVVDRYRPAAEQRNISLALCCEDQLIMMGDEQQLASAVSNLVDNAIKYSPDDAEVSVHARHEDGNVIIQVIDSGLGIPNADLDRIFERFYRVDKARSRGTGGTGLGLAVVRHVVTNHGGSIGVESTEGKGSKFSMTLPEGSADG